MNGCFSRSEQIQTLCVRRDISPRSANFWAVVLGFPGKGEMFTRALSKDAQTALALLGKSGILNNAYLAGGTACALQLGHRLSFDLDFFTPKEFEVSRMIETLKKTVDLQLREVCSGHNFR